MNPLRIWWADTRGKVVFTLIVLYIGSLINQFEMIHLTQPFITVGVVAFFDYAISLIRHKKGIITLSSVVTGLLIGLIFDESAGLVPLLSACFLAVIGKQYISFGDHRHIFNPAALGIFASSLLFHRPVAWWGASWGYVPAVIIFLGMTFALWRIRRFWMAAIFLVIYGIAFPSTIDGTVFLFAFVMLPETVTSVSGGMWTYGWGILVGILMLMLSFILKVTFDPLLSALLIADAIGGVKRFVWNNA